MVISIIIAIAIYLYIKHPIYKYKKIVESNIKEKYEGNISCKYTKTTKCENEGSLFLFNQYIKGCYIYKYEVKTDTKKFNVYITKRDNSIHLFIADSVECIDEISFTDGKIFEGGAEAFTNKESNCTKKIK